MSETHFYVGGLQSYGSGLWSLRKRKLDINNDRSRIEVAEMRFLRPVLGLTRYDSLRDTEIRKSLSVNSLNDNIIHSRKTDWSAYYAWIRMGFSAACWPIVPQEREASDTGRKDGLINIKEWKLNVWIKIIMLLWRRVARRELKEVNY